MKVTNVYIGLYQNNLESIFYKKSDNTYYDLKAKKKVSASEIQLSSLIPYNQIIGSKPILKRNIIKLYDLDRMQKVSLNKVFIGSIYELTDLVTSTIYQQSDESIEITESRFSDISLVKQDALLMSLDKFNIEKADIVYDDLMDLETGYIYKSDFDFHNGEQYVARAEKNLKSIDIIISTEEKELEKGKILEKYREFKRS